MTKALEKELKECDERWGKWSLGQCAIFAGVCERMIDIYGKDSEFNFIQSDIKFLEWYYFRHGYTINGNLQVSVLTPVFFK